MAQQYGGYDMGLAMREKAPGKTPEDLVAYYQAQKLLGEDETLKQKWCNTSLRADSLMSTHGLQATTVWRRKRTHILL